MTETVTLITNMPRIDGCAELYKFLTILAWLFVF